MRPVSRRRQRVNRSAEQVRSEFEESFPLCMICPNEATDTHEISRGPGRQNSLGERCALLRLCRRHHDELHRSWTVGQQYVLKALMDVEHFDRQRLNELRGRNKDAIDERDMWRDLPEVLARLRRVML